MAEQEFYNQGDIKVTSARVIFGAQTFALSGITSVKGVEITPARIGPIAMIAMGAIWASIGVRQFLFFVIAGFVWLLTQKTEFAIMLVTSGGEMKAYAHEDSQRISDIIAAINDAIVHRN